MIRFADKIRLSVANLAQSSPADDHDRAKVVQCFTCCSAGLGFVAGSLYIGLDSPTIGGFAYAFAAINLCAWLLLRRTPQWLDEIARALQIGLSTILLGGLVATGGPSSPALPGFVILPALWGLFAHKQRSHLSLAAFGLTSIVLVSIPAFVSLPASSTLDRRTIMRLAAAAAAYLLTLISIELQHQLYLRSRLRSDQVAHAFEDANRVKVELFDTLSHELRTPMNGILGLSSVIRDSLPDEEQRAYLDDIMRSGEQLMAMVNNTLELNNMIDGTVSPNFHQIQPLALTEAAIDAKLAAAHFKSNRITLTCEPDVPRTMVTDSYRLYRSLIALLDNAIQVTDHGNIFVRIEAQNPQVVRWTVDNDGFGLPANAVDAVFDVFVHGDHAMSHGARGLPLGLALVSANARLTGSRVGFKSLETGSRFWLDVPVEPAKPLPPLCPL